MVTGRGPHVHLAGAELGLEARAFSFTVTPCLLVGQAELEGVGFTAVGYLGAVAGLDFHGQAWGRGSTACTGLPPHSLLWPPLHPPSPQSPSGLLLYIMGENRSVAQAESPQGPWTSGDNSVCESEGCKSQGHRGWAVGFLASVACVRSWGKVPWGWTEALWQ